MYQHPFRVGQAARAALAGGAVLCAPRSVPAQISGDNFSSTELTCADIRLEKASGVPDGARHKYSFGGSCRVHQSDGEGQQHSFPIVAEAQWDSKTRTLHESLKILGDFEYYDLQVGGTLASTYLCSADPIVGPAACNGHSHQNDTKLEQFSGPFLKHKPLLAARTTLAEAITLNQNEATASNPPPPPPAGSTPVVRRGEQPPDEVLAAQPAPLVPAVDTADQSKAPRTVARPKPALHVPPPPPAGRPAPRTRR